MQSGPDRQALSRRFWVGGAVTVLVLGGIASWLWLAPGWLQVLPEEDRQGLFTRTLENLRTVCRNPKAPEARSFCQEQAALIAGLPECDDACRQLAAPHLPRPTR